MTELNKETIKNMITIHSLECDIKKTVRSHDDFINGKLASNINDFKENKNKIIKMEKRLFVLDDYDVGMVQILWKERKAVVKAFWSLIISVAIALTTFWVTNNVHQSETSRKFDKTNTNLEQLIETLEKEIIKKGGNR